MKSVFHKQSAAFLCIFLCLMAIGYCPGIQAQSSSPTGRVGQMSDQQIMQLWQQTQKAGMSESDVMKQLVSRGLSASDVTGFKQRLVQLQGQSKSKTGIQKINIKDTASFLADSSWIVAIPKIRKISPYYGFDFFSAPNISFEPNFSTSPPKTYILGPGDAITVTVTGVNEASISDKISRDGNFQMPYIGIVNLSGLTIDQAIQKLRSKMKTAYPALSTGKTSLFLTVDNVKSINISIIGEAELPGKYTVSALADFFNVLYLSGGPSENGSLRKIELIRNNKVIDTVDFYEFLQKGILHKDLKMENQDVIRFPVYTKRVALTGAVKRPSIYELLEKETIADLIRYSGGFGDNAYKASLKIVQMGDREKKIRDIGTADYNYIIPHNADSVNIESILSRFENRVILTGAVQRPGNYELTNGLTLSQLIKKADGLREDAFVNRGYIKRTKIEGAEKQFLAFDVKKITTGAEQDIVLVKEDSIYIIAKDSLQDIPTIRVGGNVREPGVFQFRKGLSLEDAIMLAGGFTNEAATHKVEISRLDRNKADTLSNKLVDLFTVNVDSSLQNPALKTVLEPMDYIFVPRLLNYRNLGGVRLRGEVLYTGDYALERRDESIQELIARAGGPTPYASLSNAQVYRNNLRVASTILSEEGKQQYRFLLLPGDSIFIPRNEPFVEVKGEVYNPQILRFKSNRFLSYISESGGITDKGNRKKAYVQYSNGVTRTIHHFLFFKNYPKVHPGSKIIVPEKTPGERKGLSIVELSALTGILTGIVSMIALLK
ncbi:MAG: hypothetical protein RLZZ28_1451 [Bacteroidota bacterium]